MYKNMTAPLAVAACLVSLHVRSFLVGIIFVKVGFQSVENSVQDSRFATRADAQAKY